jgi:hypothetical protein
MEYIEKAFLTDTFNLFAGSNGKIDMVPHGPFMSRTSKAGVCDDVCWKVDILTRKLMKS